MKKLRPAKFRNILGKGEPANIENITSDFVSLASHQLRTPLSAIKWTTEILLAKKAGPLTAKQSDHLRAIYQSNERAISLVNDLLDVSRLQEGQIHLELRPTRVEDIIEEVINNFGSEIKNRNVIVDLEILKGPLPRVETDPEKLKRVVSNLLANAIRYTSSRGQVKITIKKNDHQIKISVSDTGLGIPAADQPKIFTKFFRGAGVLKLVPDGTGLGLYISKSLVEILGGKIGFRSVAGQGSTFYFTLPLKD